MSDVSIWNHSNLDSKTRHRFFPTDMMLRSIFSNKFFNIDNCFSGGRVLDIGTMYANNLVPFSDRNWELYGTEVTHESVEIAKSSCDVNQLKAEVKLGFNRDLPFESDKFDVLLSLATIHYEESLDDVDLALKEMSRVLKKGGCALIQTAAPEHTLFKNSVRAQDGTYHLDMIDDLRHGQKFTFFEHSDELVDIAKSYFAPIEVARCTETYPNLCVDVWLLKLQKK